jgi:hypothetical protein
MSRSKVKVKARYTAEGFWVRAWWVGDNKWEMRGVPALSVRVLVCGLSVSEFELVHHFTAWYW